MTPGVEDDLAIENEVKILLCNKEELQRGEMKEIPLGEGNQKLLLVRNEDDSYCAFGSKCPHNGSPLADGIMRNGRIRCSRHGACFNSKTGDIEDFPGLDSLPIFKVSIEGDDVVIHTTTKELLMDKRIQNMNMSTKSDARVVVIGGGASSLTCSEALRQEGYDGRIIVISKGHLLPYDRPVMTKNLNAKLEDLYMRERDFYEKHEIELKLGKEVINVDVNNKAVLCKDGDIYSYDKLLIAAGLSVSKLAISGGDLQNVYYVSSPSDANMIAERAVGKNAIVVGGSFIGMEVACFLNSICKSVTVCCKHIVPFEIAFGKQIGKGLQKLHESHGVKFFTNNKVTKILGSMSVEGVELADGTLVEADLVVAGIGTSLATTFLSDTGLEVDESGYLIVDKYLRTNFEDVYASGAAIRFPLSYYENKLVNVEHWQMAHYHGKIAGLNIHSSLKRGGATPKKVDSVPFFFTEQYGIEIQYAGYGCEHDDVAVYGNVSEGAFCAFYLKKNVVVAAAAMQKGNIVALVAEKLLAGEAISRNKLNELMT